MPTGTGVSRARRAARPAIRGFMVLLLCACTDAKTTAPLPTDSVARSYTLVGATSMLPNTRGAIAISSVTGDLTHLPSLTWTSSNISVASVTAISADVATVEAKGEGTTTITAAGKDVNVSLDLSVEDNRVASVKIMPPIATLPVGLSATLSFVVANALGRALPVGPVTWTGSSGIEVSKTGVVTASFALYDARVTATASTFTASLSIRTLPPLMQVMQTNRSGTLRKPVPSPMSVSLGDSVHMVAVIHDLQGVEVQPAIPIAWSSRQPELLRVSSSGWVTPLGLSGAGASNLVTITATMGAQRDSVHIAPSPADTEARTAVRYVHAAGRAGTLLFRSNRRTDVSLGLGGINESNVAPGLLDLEATGFLAGSYSSGEASFLDVIAPAAHWTYIAYTYDVYNGLLAMNDAHEAVAPSQVLVRLAAADADVGTHYSGTDVFLVPVDAPPLEQNWLLNYEDPTYSRYSSRPVGSYDLVLVDRDNNAVIQREVTRFRITPQPGRATTYVLYRDASTTLRLFAMIDP